MRRLVLIITVLVLSLWVTAAARSEEGVGEVHDVVLTCDKVPAFQEAIKSEMRRLIGEIKAANDSHNVGRSTVALAEYRIVQLVRADLVTWKRDHCQEA